MFVGNVLRRKRVDGTGRKTPSLLTKIKALYDSKDDPGIKNLIKTKPLNLIVEAIEELDDVGLAIRFLMVSHKIKMGELFLAFSDSLKEKMMREMKSGIFTYLLDDLNSDDVYDLYQSSSSSIQKKIIFNASKQLKKEIKQLKEFRFAEAGSIMNATYATLNENMNIPEAVLHIESRSQDFDIGEEIFVIDEEGVIRGIAEVKKIFLTYIRNKGEENHILVCDVMEKSFMAVNEEEDIDEITSLFKKYNIRSLAVIDQKKKLVGIIDYQDIIPEILESNVEDIYKLHGIKETKKSYLNSSVLDIVKSRISCLLIMLFAATITTYAIDKFEEMGVALTAGISTAILVPIIPIITDMCGNTGSQTTATIIQAYSSGELNSNDFWRALKKELKISITIGGILATANFLRLILYFLVFQDSAAFRQKVHMTSADHILVTLSNAQSKLTDDSIFRMSMVGALSSSLSLWIVVIFSKLFGVLIPLLAIRFDYDPAAVSAPILTTILDTVASVIFFGIGVWMIHSAINPIFGMNVSNGKLATVPSVNNIFNLLF